MLTNVPLLKWPLQHRIKQEKCLLLYYCYHILLPLKTSLLANVHNDRITNIMFLNKRISPGIRENFYLLMSFTFNIIPIVGQKILLFSLSAFSCVSGVCCLLAASYVPLQYINDFYVFRCNLHKAINSSIILKMYTQRLQ
jgi:hypothetical protein